MSTEYSKFRINVISFSIMLCKFFIQKFLGSSFNNLIFWDGSINVIVFGYSREGEYLSFPFPSIWVQFSVLGEDL